MQIGGKLLRSVEIFDVYKEKFLKKEKLELDGFQSTS